MANLAAECGEQARTNQAVQIYRDALKNAPAEPRLWNTIAWNLATSRMDLDDSLRQARRAVDAEPA